jgi:hypothetical protein
LFRLRREEGRVWKGEKESEERKREGFGKVKRNQWGKVEGI